MAQQPPVPPPPPPPPPPVPGYGAPGQRPPQATTAAVLLFSVGGVRGLLSLIGIFAVIAAGEELGDVDNAGLLIGVIIVVLAATVLAAVLQIMGGAHTLAMRRKGWALGLSGSIVGLVLGLLSFAGAASGGSNAPGVIFTLVLFAGDIVCLIYLAQAGKMMTAQPQ